MKEMFQKYGALILTIATILVMLAVWLWGYHTGRRSATSSVGDSPCSVRRGSASATVTADTSKAETTVRFPIPTNEKQVGTITIPVRLSLKEPAEPSLPESTILVYPPSYLSNIKAEADIAPGAATKAQVDTEKGSIRSDSTTALVTIPITQKEYTDSLYTAYVSGYLPRLDSLKVKSVVITNTIKETKYRRLNFGITAGAGYGIFTRKPDIFVGVGITVNLYRH